MSSASRLLCRFNPAAWFVMKDPVRIQLLPLGATFTVARGAALQDALFAHGVEFPCGGHGRCKGCRIKVVAGSLPVSPDDERLLTGGELDLGWRLACRSRAMMDLSIELAQWEEAILADDSNFEFTPRDGFGVAVDLGSTTLVAQLLDLRTGRVLAVRTALNAQARHGADIMSRVAFAVLGGEPILRTIIREQVGRLIEELMQSSPAGSAAPADIVLVGNTVMHHLFCGLDIEPLSRAPFESPRDGPQVFGAADLGWRLAAHSRVRFLPCLGGFVGSDILAGILAVGLHRAERLSALVDLGTNGEIVVGNRERILFASTAAGPAFEGARISMGMRAVTGAITEVNPGRAGLECRVLGKVAPRGICGSGLVDAVAAGLDLGRIDPSGRLRDGQSLELAAPVKLSQADIRELQLAKGAIAAGLRVLVRQWGANLEDVVRLYLAGAFGNYINRSSARRIGLLSVPHDRVTAAGNTALLGAKLALFDPAAADAICSGLRRDIRHVALHQDPRFQEIYVEEMTFPK
jgi:uncharacterized 2Fe-2S/4Fe-4S cluster protein (DUF4445 family)